MLAPMNEVVVRVQLQQKLGRPKIRTEEEVIQLRNTVSLNCYYKK